MPELPEVETIRAGLATHIIGKEVGRVRVTKEKIVRNPVRVFTRALKGKTVARVSRHGKLLMITFREISDVLLIHLKMTGQLIYQDAAHTVAGGHQWPPVADLPNKYTHVQIDFTDGSHLFFNDLRQFGFMEVVSAKVCADRVAKMGVDPITQTLSWEHFEKVLKGRTTSIKAVLLNQALIAGIGNIYADEICFLAKVKPSKAAHRLTTTEKKALFRAIPVILKRAIVHKGTTFRDYIDSSGKQGNFTRLLKVYGRGGQMCKRCKDVQIVKTVVAQRGTHFCPICQR